MTGLRGADVEALDGLAEQVRGGAEQLGRVVGQLGARVEGTAWWGRDGAGFRDRWGAELSPGLLRVSTALETLGATLRAHAAEQRLASGVGGGWRGLGAGRQAELLREHPEVVGRTDGVPGAVRDVANRSRIAGLRAGLRAEATALAARLAGRWDGGLLTRADEDLAVVRGKLAALDAVERTLAHGGRQLLALDTSGDQTRAVVAVGDVDTADHVAVFTPGLNTTVQGSLEGYDDEVSQLRAEAEAMAVRHGDGGTVAAVSWLGYRAPQRDWEMLDLTGRSTASDHLARQGAAALAPFLDGLDSARAEPAHVTALGHSYGSLTTGLALRQTAGVDDVVFFGSPGLGTSSVADLRVPAGHAFVVEAPGDVVADTGWFGRDPSDLPGLTPLAAGPASVDGDALTGSRGHGGYLTGGSTSQHNLAAIVAGLPGRTVR